jgi:hypothetical protein
MQVILTCMPPDKRDRLEQAMNAYCDAHGIKRNDPVLYSRMANRIGSGKPTKPTSRNKVSVYGFAYWLFRQSGLV